MRRKMALSWVVGILLATLLFAALHLMTDFSFSGTDDTPILRSFMGYEGGVPAQFNMILHTAFAWLLHGLALLFPGVAWFSILQLFLLWLSCAVIGKSCVQAAWTSSLFSVKSMKRSLAFLTGLAAAIIFLPMFGAFALCRISYTTTAALLGAAAVAQLLSVDVHARPSQILRGMGLSIALLLCCYCLRQINVLPPMAFWVLGLTGKIFSLGRAVNGAEPASTGEDGANGAFASREPAVRRPRPRSKMRPLLLGALLCALCFGAFAGVRAAEIHHRGLRDFLDWQHARIQLLDYSSFTGEPTPETLEKLDWSPAKMELVSYWFFMDSDISTEAFQTLYETQPEASYTIGDRLAGIPRTLDFFGRAEPPYRYACWAFLALWVLALLVPQADGQSADKGRRSLNWQRITILLALPLGAVMLLYLAYQGRLPARAAASVLFPLGAFLCLGLFPRPGGDVRNSVPGRTTALAGCRVIALTACLALCGFSIDATTQRLLVEPDPESQARSVAPSQLDEYAIDNPDVIIIYDLSLALCDGRLFPDTSGGIPGNTLFWGGWPARSPSWMYQLAQYGIDGSAFTARDFLRDNLVLATTDGVPSELIRTYVSEIAGPADWEVYSIYDYITVFQLYEEEDWEDYEEHEDYEDANGAEDLVATSYLHSQRRRA